MIPSTRETFIVHQNMRVARLLAATTTVAFVFIGNGIAVAQAGRGLSIFENQTDVGSVVPPGVASFDAASGVYTIRSSGANLWVNVDAFHFVWKKVSGDVALTADVKLADAGSTAEPASQGAVDVPANARLHDAMYGDAAIHGNGETALQYRRNKGDTTQDIAFNIGAPQRLRLEKRGDTITLFLSAHGEPLHQVGASIKLHFEGDFYAGLGVCAHNENAVEQATFAHVELQSLPQGRVLPVLPRLRHQRRPRQHPLRQPRPRRSTAHSRPSPSIIMRAWRSLSRPARDRWKRPAGPDGKTSIF